MIHTFTEAGRAYLVRLVRAGQYFNPLQGGPDPLFPPADEDTVELYAQNDVRALLGTLLCRVPIRALQLGESYASAVEIPTVGGSVRLYAFQWRDQILPALGIEQPEPPPQEPPSPPPAPRDGDAIAF